MKKHIMDKMMRVTIAISIALKIVIVLLILTSFASCKKFVEVDTPPTAVGSEYVFSKESTTISSLLAIYSRMAEGTGFVSGGSGGLTYYGGLAGDELVNYSNSSGLQQMYTNSLLQTTGVVNTIWRQIYRHVYDCNAIIEGVAASTTLNSDFKKRILAEAYFIRAFCYFHLTNLFGDVPLMLSTDYTISLSVHRATKQEVFNQIIADLKLSKLGLSDSYSSETNTQTNERVRPNRFAATAFLARVYLFNRDYSMAEEMSTEVINNRAMYDTVGIDQVFLKNNKEAIWQLTPVLSGKNTFDASAFVLITAPSPSSSSEKNTSLQNDFVSSFEAGDKRASNWIGSITVGSNTYKYPFKYKVHLSNQPVTEYTTVLRLAELYLIRAEARIQLNKLAEGIADLNVLRSRARANPSIQVPTPLPDLSFGLTKPDALLAVERERRSELFAEGGHRWFDLKRTGRADIIMPAIKGNNWQTTDQLWPIPQSEIILNPNLKPQNPGYN